MKLYGDGAYFIAIIKKSPLRNGNSLITEMGVAHAFEHSRVQCQFALFHNHMYISCSLLFIHSFPYRHTK